MATPGMEWQVVQNPRTVELAEQDEAHLVVDEEATDRDSAYGDEISTYTASLSSSVNTFVTEYGRIYHSFRDHQGNLYPADNQEIERLDIHHTLMLCLLDRRLHWAPIGTQPQRVLDIGTGTGIWAIDFADAYPTAEVIGTDLTPIQTTLVPPNVRFVIDDYEDDWNTESNPFDYIHARYLATAVRDWPRLVQQSFNNLKPGGWVEFQDWDTLVYSTDGSIGPERPLFQFHKESCGRRTRTGYDSRPGPKIEGWCRDAGFVNIKAYKLPIPIGAWPKDKKYKQVGILNYLQFQAGMEGIALGCLARTGDDPWTFEEVQALLTGVRKDMNNPKLHGQYNFFVVYGQKPPLAPSPEEGV